MLWDVTPKYYKVIPKENGVWVGISKKINVNVAYIKLKSSCLFESSQKVRQRARNKKSETGLDDYQQYSLL
jgi:hypothetical protein